MGRITSPSRVTSRNNTSVGKRKSRKKIREASSSNAGVELDANVEVKAGAKAEAE